MRASIIEVGENVMDGHRTLVIPLLTNHLSFLFTLYIFDNIFYFIFMCLYLKTISMNSL